MQGYQPTAPASGVPGQYDPYSAPPVTGIPDQQWPAVPPAVAVKSGPPTWLYIVGALVLVVVLGAGGYLVFNNNSGSASDEKTSDSADSKSDAPKDDSSKSPGTDDTGLTTDMGTGLSYTTLGEPWQTTDFPAMVGGTNSGIAGQQFETEPGWAATFLVGELDAELLGYDGPDTLKDTVKTLADGIDAVNYSSPSSEGTKPLKGLKRDTDPEFQDIEIDGKTGIVMAYHLKWDTDELKDQGEYVLVAVIDMGEGKAAGVQVSLPESVFDAQSDAVSAALDSLSFS